MSDVIVITSGDPLLESLHFKPYRSKVERQFVLFSPNPDEPQTMELKTPWGAVLTAKNGDFLVSEIGAPNDYWPVDAVIFAESYLVTRPGYCVKNAITLLAPLTEITTGDPNQIVQVVSLEGPVDVRAGDFFLAMGIKGEIWSYPKDKVEEVLTPA